MTKPETASPALPGGEPGKVVAGMWRCSHGHYNLASPDVCAYCDEPRAAVEGDVCANCGQTYERHGRVDGEGATCPDRTGMGFELSAAALPGGEGREPNPLPCPFCGNDDFSEGVINENEGIANEHGGEATPWYAVVCVACGIQIPGARLEADAIAAWNRRTPRVASRDTRDAGAVEPVAWMVVDRDGGRRRHPTYNLKTAKHIANRMRLLQPESAPFSVIPLVPAPPGRAGTDQP